MTSYYTATHPTLLFYYIELSTGSQSHGISKFKEGEITNQIQCAARRLMCTVRKIQIARDKVGVYFRAPTTCSVQQVADEIMQTSQALPRMSKNFTAYSVGLPIKAFADTIPKEELGTSKRINQL